NEGRKRVLSFAQSCPTEYEEVFAEDLPQILFPDGSTNRQKLRPCRIISLPLPVMGPRVALSMREGKARAECKLKDVFLNLVE
ncbi:MAG: hypothetical protein Q9204_007834, partial [Flavoplaca sp. TL-2023a]